ncbi:MAG: hypothetical protein WC310_01750 [Patescibacteria group bacterium]|jgi:hypothetical protein
MPVYLIQGFFFQDQERLGLAMSSEAKGAVAVVNSGLCRFMYAGVIYPAENETANEYVGQMFDHFGDAALSDIKLSADQLEFVKKYNHRNDLIDYIFLKRNGIWVGSYSGSVVGQGSAKCVITEVPQDFFQPPE